MLDGGALGTVVDEILRPVIDGLLAEIRLRRPAIDEIQSAPLDPGRSGALVLLLETRSHGTPDIPLIIKVGPKRLIKKEAFNYRQYVQPKLRTAPSLIIGPVELEDFAALAYEVAGSPRSLTELLPLRQFIETALGSRKPLHLNEVLRPVLDDLQVWWGGFRVVERDVFNLYSFDDEEALRRTLQDVATSDLGRRFLIGDIPNPIESWRIWRQRWPKPVSHVSLIHRDLNLRNIIVDINPGRTRAGIGFERWETSYVIDFASLEQDGHLFRDLAKLIRDLCLRVHSTTVAHTDVGMRFGTERILVTHKDRNAGPPHPRSQRYDRIDYVDMGGLDSFFWEQRVLREEILSHLSTLGSLDEPAVLSGGSSHFWLIKNTLFDLITDQVWGLVRRTETDWYAPHQRTLHRWEHLDSLVALQFQCYCALLFDEEEHPGQRVAAANLCIGIHDLVEGILAGWGNKNTRPIQGIPEKFRVPK